MIVAIVETDRLTNEEITDLVKRFDKVIVEMLDVTATMVGPLKDIKLSSTGIILFVFFDHDLASRFVAHSKEVQNLSLLEENMGTAVGR